MHYCYLCCRRDRCARGRAREGIACAGNRAGSLTSTMARAHNATATRSGVICGSEACNIAQEGNIIIAVGRRCSLTFHVHTVQKQCIPYCPREPFRAYTQRHTRLPRRTHTHAHTYTRLQEVISQPSTAQISRVLLPRAEPSATDVTHWCIARGDFFPAASSRSPPASPARQDDISKARHRRGTPACTTPQHPDTHHQIARHCMRIRLFAISPRQVHHRCTRDPETPSVPSHTTPLHLARAQSRFESLDIPPDPTIWRCQHHPGTSQLDSTDHSIRIALNRSVACAGPMLHCILLLLRPSG